MLDSIFATKLDMTQAWSEQGKRYAVTRCQVEDNLVVSKQELKTNPYRQFNDDQVNSPRVIFEIGYGRKKFKNMTQPLKSKLQKSGFSQGVKQMHGLPLSTKQNQAGKKADQDENADQIKVGQILKMDQILAVGDVVKVQGRTKGKGFSGVMKRHGFKGGPKTHGQRDRDRHGGSIGAGTDPGRVWPGKKMPGRMGGTKKTVQNLVILHLNAAKNEVWLSGPIPGSYNGTVKITKTGRKKEVALNLAASGLEVASTSKKKDEKDKKNKKEAKD